MKRNSFNSSLSLSSLENVVEGSEIHVRKAGMEFLLLEQGPFAK